jgi:hypothetical protein
MGNTLGLGRAGVAIRSLREIFRFAPYRQLLGDDKKLSSFFLRQFRYGKGHAESGISAIPKIDPQVGISEDRFHWK